jgi:predicted Kef-type K+ transport protein
MMGKISMVFWIGVGMLFLPFFGIENTWKLILAVLIGMALIVLSFILRKNYKLMKYKLRKFEQEVPVETVVETAVHE